MNGLEKAGMNLAAGKYARQQISGRMSQGSQYRIPSTYIAIEQRDALQKQKSNFKQSTKQNRKSTGQINQFVNFGLKQAKQNSSISTNALSQQKIIIAQIQKNRMLDERINANANLLQNMRKTSQISTNKNKNRQSRNNMDDASFHQVNKPAHSQKRGGTASNSSALRKRQPETAQFKQQINSKLHAVQADKLPHFQKVGYLAFKSQNQIDQQFHPNLQHSNTMAGTRRQRVKNKANALQTTINMGLKLDNETQAGQSERRAFQIKKRTVVGNNKSPEPQHSGKKEPSQMGIQPKIAPKTAQSLPRRLQSNFIANINAKTVMNMSMNNSKFNFDVFRNKTGFFLPFTGVDQAYLIHRPLFTRQIELQKEKLNDFQTNKFGSVLPKSAYFDKQKVKLVYDCTHSFN